MDKQEKKRRRQQARAEQRRALSASLPLAIEDLKALFDHLDTLATQQDAFCDHTLARTEAFLVDRDIEPAPVIAWLEKKGGYCDCEVLANVEDEVADLLPQDTTS